MTKIAVLGWGSLLWDKGHPRQKAFLESLIDGNWNNDGPEIPIEFSRISSGTPRTNILTLVIDDQHGAVCQVAWRLSKGDKVEKALEDLRVREGTNICQIGRLYCAKDREPVFKSKKAFEAISSWADKRDIDAVIWTDLKSNFRDKKGETFSVAGAVSHIESLPDSEKGEAIKYIYNAPEFVKTEFRSTIQEKSWFNS